MRPQFWIMRASVGECQVCSRDDYVSGQSVSETGKE